MSTRGWLSFLMEWEEQEDPSPAMSAWQHNFCISLSSTLDQPLAEITLFWRKRCCHLSATFVRRENQPPTPHPANRAVWLKHLIIGGLWWNLRPLLSVLSEAGAQIMELGVFWGGFRKVLILPTLWAGASRAWRPVLCKHRDAPPPPEDYSAHLGWGNFLLQGGQTAVEALWAIKVQ